MTNLMKIMSFLDLKMEIKRRNENLCKEHEALSVEVNKIRKELDEHKHIDAMSNDECMKELEELKI